MNRYSLHFKYDVNKANWSEFIDKPLSILCFASIREVNNEFVLWYYFRAGGHPLYIFEDCFPSLPLHFLLSSEIDKNLALLNIRNRNNKLLRFICREVLEYDNTAWIRINR
jgi:hypothetical protein